jgi:MFS family permease
MEPALPERLRSVLVTYADRLRAFTPNARLYLLNVILVGAAMGVFRLLFNFYVLSLGYDESLLGNLITVSSFTSLFAALPMGYLADSIGRKRSLVSGNFTLVLAVLGMVLWPNQLVFYLMNVLTGLAQALMGVTMGPFLMENSSEKERTYLFSFSSGFMMASAFIGNWIGGYLPTWMSTWQGFDATGAEAYRWSLGIVLFSVLAGVLPLLLLKMNRLPRAERSVFTPFKYFGTHKSLLSKLILPTLIISIGAGFIMPFMNVFYRNVYNQSDAAIGTLFAWGSLAMGIGLMLAPPIADRIGKIQLVVLTQGLSIPFLFMMGFSPVFGLSAFAYFIRLSLMNMTMPVYQTFVMENVEPSARATVASLVSMANSFGWAFSPMISGWFQVNYGFAPAFASTIALYVISVLLTWRFFLSPRTKIQEPV